MRNRMSELYDQAVEWYAAGMRMYEIAEMLGVSRGCIYSALRKRNVSFRGDSKAVPGERNGFYRGGPRSYEKATFHLHNEIEAGRIERKYECEDCGVENYDKNGIEAHHCDYNKPLDVMWLCKKCHYKWHQNNVAVSRIAPDHIRRMQRDTQGRFYRGEA